MWTHPLHEIEFLGKLMKNKKKKHIHKMKIQPSQKY